MRVNGSVEKVPVLVAIGVNEEGHRTVLGLQAGDRDCNVAGSRLCD
jgi:transposase-like protein